MFSPPNPRFLPEPRRFAEKAAALLLRVPNLNLRDGGVSSSGTSLVHSVITTRRHLRTDQPVSNPGQPALSASVERLRGRRRPR